MRPDYWHKQTADKPLFPDLEWSKPVNKQHAGKLAIIGGNLRGFSAPATAFAEANKAGAGSLMVVLPVAIQKVVGRFLPEAVFVPSTPIGSFGSPSLAELLDAAEWADAVLLAGDFGKNSETTVVIEKFLQKCKGALTAAGDAVDLFVQTPHSLLKREKTLLVLDFAQLQKLASSVQFGSPFTSEMGMVRFVDTLHEFTTQFPAFILVSYADNLVVSVNGQVSTTKAKDTADWPVASATHASVWWLQHPNQTFEAITSSIT